VQWWTALTEPSHPGTHLARMGPAGGREVVTRPAGLPPPPVGRHQLSTEGSSPLGMDQAGYHVGLDTNN